MGFNLGTPYRQLALKKFGGLYTETPDRDLPEGVSPRCHDNSFFAQSLTIRPGLQNIIQFGNESISKFAGAGADGGGDVPWTSPSSIVGPPGGSVASITVPSFASSNLLIASVYGFSISNGQQISGIKVSVTGRQSSIGTDLFASIWNNGKIGMQKIFALPPATGTVPLGSPTDGWSTGAMAPIVESGTFGVVITGTSGLRANSFFIDAIEITIYLTAAKAPGFNWIKTFDAPGQGPLTLALDTLGTIWQEDVDTTPGVMNSIYTNITPGAKVLAQNAASRIFLTFSDLVNALDQPRQYDGTNLDRISQVGPGLGPQVVVGNTEYTINTSPTGLFQPNAPQTIGTVSWTSAPGIEAPGNLLIMAPPTINPAFIAGVNIGDTIFISGLPTLAGQNPNGTFLVADVGVFAPTGFQFITVIEPSVQNATATGLSATYQKTVALVSLATPIPNGLAQVGGNLTIAGADDSSWDGTYTITGTPGTGQLTITSISWTPTTATYTYNLVQGTAPGWQAGTAYDVGTTIADPNIPGQIWTVENGGISGGTIPAFATSPQTDGTVTWTSSAGNILVTVAGTDSNGGEFNVASAAIQTANQNTFTVNIASPNSGSGAESGSAFSGSGTLFEIDPGLATLGTLTNPILSASGGGTATLAGAAQPGQRYAIQMFLTRNGFITPASPPIAFNTSASTSGLTFTNLVIGPTDVIARIVAVTPANAGIGGPYYWIPEDVTVQNIATGVSQTFNKTIINDNTSGQSGLINFSDTVLLTGENVTEQGNNVLQKRELGACSGVTQYAGRMCYWGEQTKVDNFQNLTFDGGSLVGSPNIPAGWTVNTVLAPLIKLLDSSIFGKSLLFTNTTGSTFNPSPAFPVGIMTQPACVDAFNAPQIDANTAYSIRVTVRVPSGNKLGNLSIGLLSLSTGSWVATFECSMLTQSFAIYTLPLPNPLWQTVPPDLQLIYFPQDIPNGGDIEVERFDVFPTLQPVYKNQLTVSYVDDFESIDGVTGIVDVSQSNAQPIHTAYVLFDTLYIEKTNSGVKTQDNGSTEPAGWQVTTVTNGVGALGSLAADTTTSEDNGTGEDYTLVASPQGLYIFNGGNHTKISQEIQSLWNLMYQPSLGTVWVKNDILNKRIFVGIPLPTPNKWMPDAPVNLTPAQPNVIMQMSYLGLESPDELGGSPPAHISMFTGAMLARDLVRKWNPWLIQTQAVDWIRRQDGSLQLWVGSIAGLGKIYWLTETALSDDGSIILQKYCTYGFNDPANNQVMQLGEVRKLIGYLTGTIEGNGNLLITDYPESLDTPYPDVLLPVVMSKPSTDDVNVPVNQTANRIFFDFSVNGLNNYFELKRLVVGIQPDPLIPVSGI